MKTARMGRCFAVVAVLFLGSSLATAAQVFFDPADVTSNQVYDWAVGTTWADVDGVDVIPGVGDDVFIDGNGTYRTNLKMSDDREINSLTFNSNMKFGLGYTDNYGNTAELPVKTLTITSGNISTTAGTVLAQYSNIRSTIAIPAGTNATWDFGDSSISGNSYTLGLYNVIADSSVTITKNGTKGFTLAGADNAANLAATWHIGGGKVGLSVTGALGTGPVRFDGATAVDFAGNLTTHTNNFDINGQSLLFTVHTYTAGTPAVTYRKVAILEGNITGSGTIDKNFTASAGALVFAGPNNTFTGDIVIPLGLVSLDGVFTGLGNISQPSSNNGETFLTGTGNVGMAQDKYVRVNGYKAACVSMTALP